MEMRITRLRAYRCSVSSNVDYECRWRPSARLKNPPAPLGCVTPSPLPGAKSGLKFFESRIDFVSRFYREIKGPENPSSLSLPPGDQTLETSKICAWTETRRCNAPANPITAGHVRSNFSGIMRINCKNLTITSSSSDSDRLNRVLRSSLIQTETCRTLNGSLRAAREKCKQWDLSDKQID